MDERIPMGERRPGTVVAIATAVGAVVVRIGGDRVGEFGLRHRGEARDVAVVEGSLAVATADDVVLVGEATAETGFGPAVAVGADGGDLLAAGPDGRVARGPEWTDLGTVADPRAFGGGLLAAGEGVYRCGDSLDSLGLDAARDVAPGYAATADGLYRRDGGEWVREAGSASAVAASGGRAHAVSDGHLRARVEGTWSPVEVPADGLVDVAHGPTTYAVTGDGTLLVDGGDAWRARALGVPDARRLVAADG